MKKHPSHSLVALASLGTCAGLLVALVTGCETQNVDHQGAATEFLHTAEPPPRSHRDATIAAAQTRPQERPTRKTAAQPSPAATASAGSESQSRKPKKVEAEVHDASELQIDPETRQRMGSTAPGTADSNKKAKPGKTEAEVRDASDLQIDDQTKKQMDKSN